MESKNNNLEEQLAAYSLIARVIAVAAADGCDRAALRKEQLDDNDVGQILQEMEAGQRPQWKDIADRSPTYNSYLANKIS